MERRRANKLLLLVGSNPLPNYLAAIVLEPREVVLLYSPETVPQRDCLREALQARSPAPAVSVVSVEDATDARQVRDACASLTVDHLHYSGGTKTMAAHARQAIEIRDDQASYLDERHGRLRFDDQVDVYLDRLQLALTLDTVLTLHGLKRIGQPAAISPEKAQRIAADVLHNPKAAHERYEGDGGWLEQWTANQIRSATGLTPETNVHCERTPQPGMPRAQLEVDVALLKGHRMYVISCTTSRNRAVCKGKLFEVAVRARHLGGDLARSALVCLLDGSDAAGDYVEQLRSHIASVWDAPNQPEVFGLRDLREWVGIDGAADLTTLREWLDR